MVYISDLIKIEHVVDTETGHILSTKQHKMKMYLFTERGFKFNNNNRTLKTYPSVKWPKLSHSDLGLLFLLGRVMQDGNAIPLSMEEIANVLSLSVNRAYLFINRMIKKKMIKRGGRSLYINPSYLFVGSWMSPELYFLFQESLDAIIPKWVQKKFKGE